MQRIGMFTVQIVNCYSSLLPTLSKYVEDVSAYIAGFVVRKLLPKVKCDECRSLLVDTGNTDSSALICVKNNGGLVIPSAAVVRTVHVAERKLRALILSCNEPVHAISRIGAKLEVFVLHDIGNLSALFGNTSHMTVVIVAEINSNKGLLITCQSKVLTDRSSKAIA